MTSLEIAELTGKQHKDLMKAIRNMEPAWEKVNGRKFALVEYRDKKSELRPCYALTQEECLYIATKFNDEARARLVRRWKELELAERKRQQQELQTVAERAAMLRDVCEQLRPKAEFAEALLCSEDTLTVTQIAQDYGMSAIRFNKLLKEHMIQRKVGGQWVLYAPHQGHDYVRCYSTYHVSPKDGSVHTTQVMRWTQAGRRFLFEALKAKDILPNTLQSKGIQSL